MALDKLRVELRETVNQSRNLADSIDGALVLLLDETQDISEIRAEICNKIIVGLQAQDRLEQRCKSIEQIIDLMSEASTQIAHATEAWSRLSLDELANPEMSGKGTTQSGEIEFF